MTTLAERLRSWAQNEEMVDGHYTEHGMDCIAASAIIDKAEELLQSTVDLLKSEQDKALLGGNVLLRRPGDRRMY